MSIPQTRDLFKLVERGWSLEAAIEELWPGACPIYWQRRLEKFDPARVQPITPISSGKVNGNGGTPAPAGLSIADQRLAARASLPLGSQQPKPKTVGSVPSNWIRGGAR